MNKLIDDIQIAYYYNKGKFYGSIKTKRSNQYMKLVKVVFLFLRKFVAATLLFIACVFATVSIIVSVEDEE